MADHQTMLSKQIRLLGAIGHSSKFSPKRDENYRYCIRKTTTKEKTEPLSPIQHTKMETAVVANNIQPSCRKVKQFPL